MDILGWIHKPFKKLFRHWTSKFILESFCFPPVSDPCHILNGLNHSLMWQPTNSMGMEARMQPRQDVLLDGLRKIIHPPKHHILEFLHYHFISVETQGKKATFVSKDSWENWKQKWNTPKVQKFVIKTLKTGSPRPLLMGLHHQLTQEALLPIMSMGND